MSIFNRTSLMESINEIDVEPYKGHIAPTMESVIEMGAELEESVYKLNTSLYVADLLLEQRSQAGEDVEALTEAAVGDFFSKMSKKFKEIWAKIKTFFSNIFNKIAGFISVGKKFMDTHKEGILKAANNKDAKWIEYAEHDDFDSIEGLIAEFTSFVKNVGNSLKDYEAKTIKLDNLHSGKNYEGCEAHTCKKLPGSPETYDAAKDVVKKILKGKKTGEKKTLDKTSLTKMIKVVEEYISKGASEIKKEAKTMDDLCKNCISSIDKLKSAVKESSNQQMNEISKYCTEMSKAISFAQWFSGKTTSGYTQRYKYYLSIIKAFASANSKLVSSKEAVETYAYGSDSLLENILEAF